MVNTHASITDKIRLLIMWFETTSGCILLQHSLGQHAAKSDASYQAITGLRMLHKMLTHTAYATLIYEIKGSPD